jgi:hypothetical protein
MVLRKRDDGSREALQEGAPLVGGSGGAAKPGGRAAHYTGHMTIYVLVVALISATGGMLFG